MAKKINSINEKEKKLVFLFPDALTINATVFFTALDAAILEEIPMVGGSYQDTYQLDKIA